MIRKSLQEYSPNVGINVGINSNDTLEKEVLSLLKTNPAHSARSLGEQLNVSQRQIERILARLKKEGIVKRIGSNKSGYWIVL